MKLLAIDSNSILNRAFYGVRPLTTKDGVHTNAVYGFFNIVLKLIEDVAPDAVAFAFDVSRVTFRSEKFDYYKAQRKGMPEELAMQLPFVKELLRSMGYTIIEKEGYEADDILGTLATQMGKKGHQVIIATGDRDSYQLISEHTQVLLASSKMGRAEYNIFDIPKIKEVYGLEPKQMIDVKALMGDASDNIPGVTGIGEKTALTLIQTFGSLEGVYGHLEDPAIKKGVRQKLEAGRQQALDSLFLATIDCDVALDTEIEHYQKKEMDREATYHTLARLEMSALIKRLGLTGEHAPAPANDTGEAATKEIVILPFVGTESVESLLKEEARLALAHTAQGELTITCKQGTMRIPPEMEGEVLKRCYQSRVALCADDCKAFSHQAIEMGLPRPKFAFCITLAAYLLSPSSADYDIDHIWKQYDLPQPVGEEAAVKGEEVFVLWERLQEQIAAFDLEYLLQKVEIPLAYVLSDMEIRGFTIDEAEIEEYGKQLDVMIGRTEEEIYELAGERFNINSPKQLGVILFEKLELPVRKKTKTGYSTNAEVLESLQDHHPIIQLILSYRTFSKLKSTYVDGLMRVVSEDGKIHTKFIQTETRTGRISSIEPNMQNIPVRTALGSELRKFFVADAGKRLIDADYSQIELRVLSHMADDQNMQEAFLTGEDIHRNTAARVFNMPKEMVTSEMRRRAKAVNFGIIYGIGAFSLSKDIGVSMAEASAYIKDYLTVYGGVKKYMEDTIAFAKETGYVKTNYGRRRYLPELKSSNKNMQAFGQRVAMNMPIQGTAADIIKIAMVRVFDRLEEEGMRSRLILQVHDELIVESPLDEVEKAKEILTYEMEHAADLKIPLSVDANDGENWYDAKQ